MTQSPSARSVAQHAVEHAVDPAHTHPRWATARALAVAIVLSLVVGAWTKQAELVSLTSQISESTPPIASILALFALPGMAGLLAKLAERLEAGGRTSGLSRLCRRLVLTPGEILVVFVFLAITGAMPGVGLFRQVMPCLMVPQYFGTPQDHLEEMAGHMPPAWAPTDPEIARVFWEGGGNGFPVYGFEHLPVVGPLLASVAHFVLGPTLVPWEHWLIPFLLWTGYLSAYFISAFCLIALFRRTWEEDERLSFPVSSLAVEMLRPEGSLLSGLSFHRDPLVWVGFSLAVLYNTMNALKVFNPSLPALGISYPLGNLFTESPWDTMRGLSIFYKPEILGIGYLVPSDVLFSIWFFTLAGWLVRPMAKMVGYSPGGFPFITQQAMGAFILLGGYFLYQARARLAQLAGSVLRGEIDPEAAAEPIPPQLALIGTIVGIAIVIGMPIAFGVIWWHSAFYFGLMLLVLIVYSRNRAEMGFPIVWGYPLYRQRPTMIYALGSRAFVSADNMKSFTLLTVFSWLQRSVNQAITMTGHEAHVAAFRLGGNRRTISTIVLIALVFGLMLAFLVNLSAFYEFGGLVLSSPDGVSGGQMTSEVLSQYRAVSQWIDSPEPRSVEKLVYTGIGAVLALAMVLVRHVWMRCPFHPGGYAIAYTHEAPYMWFPALVLWTAKTVTVYIGGAGLYRRVAPAFLAFTLGHFFSVGVWSLLGLTAGEWVRRYIVWFL